MNSQHDLHPSKKETAGVHTHALRELLRLGCCGAGAQLDHTALAGSPVVYSQEDQSRGSCETPDWDNLLSLQLSTDKEFRKHRSRVAYLSLYYNWGVLTVSHAPLDRILSRSEGRAALLSAPQEPACLPEWGPRRGKGLITTVCEHKD